MSNLHTVIKVYKKDGESSWIDTSFEIRPMYRTIVIEEGIDDYLNTVEFDLLNRDDLYYNQFYCGDSSTTNYTLKFPLRVDGSSPAEGVDFSVYIYNDSLSQWVLIPSTHSTYGWSVSETDITFNTAPPQSNVKDNNIRINYAAIETGDLLEVYQFIDKTTYDINDLVLSATSKTPRVKKSGNSQNIVTIRGVDLLQVIFLIRVNLSSSSKHRWTTDEIIREIVKEVKRKNPNTPIDLEESLKSTSISSNYTDSSGTTSTFPEQDIAIAFENAIQLINKYSDEKFTNDGRYTYGMRRKDGQKLYYFYWETKNQDVKDIINETDNIINIEEKVHEDDIVNFIDIMCGTDAYGNHIITHVYDSESIAKNKLRVISRTTDDYGQFIIEKEKEAQSSSWDIDSKGNYTSKFPSTYNFTFTTFKDEDGNTITVTNDSEFNNAVITEMRRRAKDEMQPVVNMYAEELPEVVLTRARDKTGYVLGGKYQFNFTSRNFIDKKLRLVQRRRNDVHHILTFREDPEDRRQRLEQ